MKLELIKEIVCKNLSISEDDIFKKTRKKETMDARHLFRFFARKYTKKSLQKIANYSNCKEHASTINSIKRVDNFLANEKDFKKKYEKIENDLSVFLEINKKQYVEKLNTYKKKLIIEILSSNTIDDIKYILKKHI